MKYTTKLGCTIIFSKVKSLEDHRNGVVINSAMDGLPIMEDDEYKEFKKLYFEWLENKESRPIFWISDSTVKQIKKLGGKIPDGIRLIVEKKR